MCNQTFTTWRNMDEKAKHGEHVAQGKEAHVCIIIDKEAAEKISKNNIASVLKRTKPRQLAMSIYTPTSSFFIFV